MLWVFDPDFPHRERDKVYAFALHSGEMREYTREQVSSRLSPMGGEARDAAVAEYLRWKEARGSTFLKEEERRREQKAEEAKRAAIEEERRRAERVRALAGRMSRRQARDAQAVAELIDERRIPFLAHFTCVENLAGIAERGIVPRNLLPPGFLHNDAMRLDGFPEASSLSVGFPNYLMFYRYRCLNPEANWAVALVSTGILAELPCLFFPTNAANGRFRDADDESLERRMGLEGLSSMFFDEPPGLREERGLPARATTDPQAEVLVFAAVSPARIGAVCLLRPDPDAAAMLKSGLPHARVSVSGKLFEPRADFRFWPAGARIATEHADAPEDECPF